MIVAGTLIFLEPSAIMDRGSMNGAFSGSGRCHTFDAKADGYVRGEAVNTVYLKRLDDALRDGDPIRAIIRGTASNSDGRTPGLTYPNSSAHAAAIRRAYQNADIDSFDETGYLECHGTGTLAGDPMEVAGLASVFAPTRSLDNSLLIGSVKSNIGHSEPAAGMSGLIKAILAVERGVVPGTPTFLTPNPRIDFQASRVRVSNRAVPWPKQSLRRASVNSFGFGGANAHAVIESAGCFLGQDSQSFVSSYGRRPGLNAAAEQEATSRPYVLALSANDRDSLKQNADALFAFLINPAVTVALGDVAYTLSERRTHHFYRGYVTIRPGFDSEPELHIVQKPRTPPQSTLR